MLKCIKGAAENIHGNNEVKDIVSRLSDRYYVLCKKADDNVKNIQILLRE